MVILGNLSYMAKKRPEDIIDELKKTVGDEFFKANPIKKFPEDFLSRRVKTEFEGILLPGGKLKLKFEKKVQICFESGMVLWEFDSLERAKYILYARELVLRSEPTVPKRLRRPEATTQSIKDILPEIGQYVYKVPKSEIVVKRAVQKYEKYVEEMRDKLIKAYLERGAERIIAEKLAGQEFEEIGLGKL
jgi:hypothetical protein